MTITKAATTDAFVVVDVPAAPVASGVVRCARKILQDGAVNLARTLTYTYAAFGQQVSGASAGINAEGDARDAAVEAFVGEFADSVNDGSLRLQPAKGVSQAELATWNAPQPTIGAEESDAALAASVFAAARAVRDLAGAVVAVEANAPGADAITAAFQQAGATATSRPLAELLSTTNDVVVVGSKPGVLDHNNIAGVGSALVLGASGLAITARGLAVGGRQGATVLADFVTAAGPALAGVGLTTDEISTVVSNVVAKTLDHPEGPYLAACYLAEDFLRTYTEDLPFGRPMAA